MINTNWDRWIFASCSKFIDNRKNNVKLYIEGQDRSSKKEEDYAEMRYNGPFYLQSSPKNYKLNIELNILVNAKKDDSDNHKIYRMCGIFESSLEAYIPVYRYGPDSVIDTREYLGCLRRILNGHREVITNHYGQVSPDIQVIQSTITAYYEMDLTI